jgi:hypothetical protein
LVNMSVNPSSDPSDIKNFLIGLSLSWNPVQEHLTGTFAYKINVDSINIIIFIC